MPEAVESPVEVDSTLFRAKSEPRVETVPVEEQGVTGEEQVTTPDVEVPVSMQDEPYLVEMLDMGEAKGHFEMERLVNDINDFVKEEFERTGMADTKEAYEEVINSLIKRLNLPKNVDVYTKVEKIAELAEINQKLYYAIKDRDKLINADPSTLTSKQLKKRIEDE